MSPFIRRTPLFVLLTTFSLTALSQELSLPISVAPLKGDILNEEVWDFSRQWLSDDKARTSVCVYGDTLLSEVYDGRRYWYAINGDSISYRGEEDRLTSIMLEKPAFLSHVPLLVGTINRVPVFEAAGTGGGRKFVVKETGTIEFSSSAKYGKLILAPGDTVANVLAVRERRKVNAFFSGDSLHNTTDLITDIYRWFGSAGTTSLLPLAIQRSVYLSPVTDRAEPVISLAFLPERGGFGAPEHDKDKPDYNIDTDAVEAALNDAVVSYDGRNVTVSVTMPQAGLCVTLDIMDAAGHLYMHDETFSDGTLYAISLDCSSLRSGQYIAAVGVRDINATPKKELINIH